MGAGRRKEGFLKQGTLKMSLKDDGKLLNEEHVRELHGSSWNMESRSKMCKCPSGRAREPDHRAFHAK